QPALRERRLGWVACGECEDVFLFERGAVDRADARRVVVGGGDEEADVVADARLELDVLPDRDAIDGVVLGGQVAEPWAGALGAGSYRARLNADRLANRAVGREEAIELYADRRRARNPLRFVLRVLPHDLRRRSLAPR